MLSKKLAMESLEMRTMLTAALEFLAEADRPSFVVGDINGDLSFDSGDLVEIFKAGKYEDGIPKNADYTDGDMNFDQDVDSSDLVFALTHGDYQTDSTSPQAWEMPDRQPGFCSSDLVVLMIYDRYNDTERGASVEQGDFNRDGVFDSSDLLLAMESGDYEQHLNCL